MNDQLSRIARIGLKENQKDQQRAKKSSVCQTLNKHVKSLAWQNVYQPK
jgi:hypothetical protein